MSVYAYDSRKTGRVKQGKCGRQDAGGGNLPCFGCSVPEYKNPQALCIYDFSAGRNGGPVRLRLKAASGLRTPVCAAEYQGILTFRHSHNQARQAYSSSCCPKTLKIINLENPFLCFPSCCLKTFKIPDLENPFLCSPSCCLKTFKNMIPRKPFPFSIIF